jgi:DNA-directed RNA polymerase specialized sigma24 family protein
MALVTIPLDFDETRNPRGVIPICIEDMDRYGRAINPGWFYAVFPIADPLRRLAARILGDVWRVSELAEGSVHAQWYKHGDDLGRNPSGRIYAHARWTARDLLAGGRNARRGVEVELLDALRENLRAADNLAVTVEAKEIAEALDQQFQANGVPHVSEMLDLWLYGWKWPEIAEEIGKQPKAATKDFWRWFKKGLRELNLL